MPKGIKGSGKPRGKKIDETPVITIEKKQGDENTMVVKYKQDVDKRRLIPCMLAIVDALYDKDGDAATWRPIREKIEAL